MAGRSRFIWLGYGLITLALFVVAGSMLVPTPEPDAHDRWAQLARQCARFSPIGYTPTEATMGPIQKMFYVHLPIAINTFLAAAVVFIACIGYLWRRDVRWDDLAAGSAKVAVLLGSIVLITGMIWAKKAWGAWWVWTPRLTFSLVLWLLYVVYTMLRTSIESADRRALVSAVYGIVAFLDVPLVWLSARLIKDPFHPGQIGLPDRAMQITLAVWFIPVTLLTAGLIVGACLRARGLRIRKGNSSL